MNHDGDLGLGADPSLQPRPIHPAPALAHPATQAQRWHQRHYWPVLGFGVPLTLMSAVSLVLFLGDDHEQWAWGLVGPFGLFLLGAAWYLDEVPRQKRLLRRTPWVEYPLANVTTTALTKVGDVSVQFLDGDGRTHTYQMRTNDYAFEQGDRPIWFAGTPGRQWAVLSLRQGQCTGMGYTRWVGTVQSGLGTGADVVRRHLARPGSTAASATPRPTIPWARRLDPAPASEHPASRGARLPGREESWVAATLVLLLVLALPVLLGRHRPDVVEQHPLLHWLPPVLGVLAPLALGLGWYLLGPVPQQQRLMRRHPWVEHGDATVTVGYRERHGDVLVDVRDEQERTHRYRVAPADRDFLTGDRPVWMAGPLGGPTCVISLREGRCLGLGHLSRSPHDPVPGRDDVPGRRRSHDLGR